MHKWILAFCLTPFCAFASNSLQVEINSVSAEGVGSALGHISISESAYGLVFTPEIKGLSAGIHGFHVHTHPSCESADKEGKASAAEAAGGHLNPDNTGHGLPWDDQAHLGDLPALYVAADGSSTQAVLAPRLKSLDQVKNRSLMLHAGGDNHRDHPLPLGGGGARIACGVVR